MERIADAPGTDSFDPGRPDPSLAAKIGSPPMRKAESSDFQRDVEVGIPPGPTMEQALAEWKMKHGDAPAARSAGVTMVEPDGRVWFVEPRNHYGTYQAALPKGRVGKGETEQEAALREVHEETGLTSAIMGVVGTYVGDTTVTTFYRARRTGGAPWAGSPDETWSVKLAWPEDAAKVFKQPHVIALQDAGLLP